MSGTFTQVSDVKGVRTRKKLIEVALPLDAINAACAREKAIRFGHPSALHLWWARRPLAAARALIFAQMVDDPSGYPELYPGEAEQEKERQRLFKIIIDLVQWENTANEDVLSVARTEMLKSWRQACVDNAEHPKAPELFDQSQLPEFHDPFAGGGTIPLEAQRLGFRSHASDLNPVSVLINKILLEIPAVFSGVAPINREARTEGRLLETVWRGAEGLAMDFRHYGNRVSEEAKRRIGQLYPPITVTGEMAAHRPDLQRLIGRTLPVVAWLWARTVKSPNPAFAAIDVPLVSSFVLSTKASKEAYIDPIVGASDYRFDVRSGVPSNLAEAREGTKLARGAHFRCIMSGSPITGDYIKQEGTNGRIGARLMAIVAQDDRGRVYLSPTNEHEKIARDLKPKWKPEGSLVEDARAFTPYLYGLKHWSDLFTDRQLTALTTLSDVIAEIREEVMQDAMSAGMRDDGLGLSSGGSGARAYSEAIASLCSLAVSKLADSASNLVIWKPSMDQAIHVFARQAIPMVWDFAECNIFGQSMGAYAVTLSNMARALELLPANPAGFSVQADAQQQHISRGKVVSTDPPYFDNVPYADLSDFFYAWLRPQLKAIYPDLFATVATPKREELVALAYRHRSKPEAGKFFMDGMTQAMRRLSAEAHPAFPISIYYAFKQAEGNEHDGVASTGWETFLDAVVSAGFIIDGTWPIRTELANRMRSQNANALASSIVLVCRARFVEGVRITRREFIKALKEELPAAVARMQYENIAPVDLAQAAIGPGMSVFTRYEQVVDADGKALSVREALALVNEALDEVLAAQEGDFDAESRFAIAWFEQTGFDEGEFGIADVLSRAKNTAISVLEEEGVAKAGGGRFRLLRPEEYSVDFAPRANVSVWRTMHHLVRALQDGGEGAAAAVVRGLGVEADVARELAYRLYSIADRKKRSLDALSYNALVQSWPEIIALSRDEQRETQQAELFGGL